MEGNAKALKYLLYGDARWRDTRECCALDALDVRKMARKFRRRSRCRIFARRFRRWFFWRKASGLLPPIPPDSYHSNLQVGIIPGRSPQWVGNGSCLGARREGNVAWCWWLLLKYEPIIVTFFHFTYTTLKRERILSEIRRFITGLADLSGKTIQTRCVAKFDLVERFWTSHLPTWMWSNRLMKLEMQEKNWL